MGVIVVMPLRVGRVEGVEGQQRPEPLAAFAGDQGLTRDLAGYGQARAFDGVVASSAMKRSTASAMRDSIRPNQMKQSYLEVIHRVLRIQELRICKPDNLRPHRLDFA